MKRTNVRKLELQIYYAQVLFPIVCPIFWLICFSNLHMYILIVVCFFVQPMSMVLPGVVGFKLSGKLKNGVTATDLVLTVTQMLRKHGVVGKFVEFYGNHIYLLQLTPFIKSF